MNKCDYCENGSTYSLGWMGRDSVMHQIYACDDHRTIGTLQQTQDLGFDDFKERMRSYANIPNMMINSQLS